jgi:uroporphyrinogen decarboxylase
MDYKPYDRMPLYYFGTWPETKQRWRKEGFTGVMAESGSGGPQLDFMDTDWETSFDGTGNIWNNQGLLIPQPIGDLPAELIEDNDEYRVIRKATGGVLKTSKPGSSISQHLQPDLHPTRKDWKRFKQYLNPDDPRRTPPDFQKKAALLDRREHVTCFLAGSLFGWMFDWMGLEAVSCLPYDDPKLYWEIIAFMSDYFMQANSRFLDRVNFDFAYFFEDCCFNTGPMISPEIYRRFYHPNYLRMIEFYRSKGVRWMLIDSDGKVDALLPCWLESGFDIIFPIEIGTWKSYPPAFRKQYGRKLRMFGGVNKHVIAEGEVSIRKELMHLKPLAEEGGFIPIPDHRIPPNVSLGQMRQYCSIFHEIF